MNKEIIHHNFFSLYYPKYIEDSELNEAFIEEVHLFYKGTMTPNYHLDSNEPHKFDVVLLPITDIRYTLKKYSNNNDRAVYINKIIDEKFANMLIVVNPIYKMDQLLSYHFDKFEGKSDDFFKHIIYVIIPIIKAFINNLSKEKCTLDESLLQDQQIVELIHNWIKSKKGKGNENQNQNTDQLDTLFYAKWSVYIAIIAIIVSIIIAIIMNGKY